MVLSLVTVRGLPPPRLSSPAPSEVTVTPLSVRIAGAVAARPPVNSVVPPPPNVSVPVLLNVVSPAIVLVLPVKLTL